MLESHSACLHQMVDVPSSSGQLKQAFLGPPSKSPVLCFSRQRLNLHAFILTCQAGRLKLSDCKILSDGHGFSIKSRDQDPPQWICRML